MPPLDDGVVSGRPRDASLKNWVRRRARSLVRRGWTPRSARPPPARARRRFESASNCVLMRACSKSVCPSTSSRNPWWSCRPRRRGASQQGRVSRARASARVAPCASTLAIIESTRRGWMCQRATCIERMPDLPAGPGAQCARARRAKQRAGSSAHRRTSIAAPRAPAVPMAMAHRGDGSAYSRDPCP